MIQQRLRIFIASACLAAGLVSPAAADTSVGAGFFAPAQGGASVGVVATAGLSLPVVPIAPQVSLALPFRGGRYAVTGEARIGRPSAYIGAGVGVARLDTNGSTGTIYDVFVGKRIAPLTTVEARFYGFGSDRAGTSGYLGLRFAI